MINSIERLTDLCEKYVSQEDEQFDITPHVDRYDPLHRHSRNKVTYDLVERSIWQTQEAIVRAFETKQSLLIYGDPGLGKSSIVLASADELAEIVNERTGTKRKVVEWSSLSTEEQREIIDKELYKDYFFVWDIRTAMMEPSDITGIINIRSRQEYLEMKPQLYAYIMSIPESAGLLFLDEINQGHQQVQKALFQLVLDRKMGALKMNDNWGIVAAGNLGDEFNEPLPIALTSRFDSGVMVADANTWLKWARKYGVNEYICSFVESNPEENFYKAPDAGNASNQFPCPRSFVALSKAMEWIHNRSKKHPGYPVLTEIHSAAAGKCGDVWGSRFVTFLQFSRHFDWDKVVADPTKYVTLKKNPNDPAGVKLDEFHGLLLYLVKQIEARMKSDKYDKKKTVIELINVISRIDEEWKATFFSKLNTMDRQVTADVISTIFNNKTVEPFKSFNEHDLKLMLAMGQKKNL
jgi:hypothetical protein